MINLAHVVLRYSNLARVQSFLTSDDETITIVKYTKSTKLNEGFDGLVFAVSYLLIKPNFFYDIVLQTDK